MPVEVSLLECAGCGAPLESSGASGGQIQCQYCGRNLVISGQTTAMPQAAPVQHTLTDNLLRGYTGKHYGEGRRYGVTEMANRDWQCVEHGMWPVAGRATTNFSRSWHAETIVGPPRVYPRCGDIWGAWAPKSRVSHVEWLEADFEVGEHGARAIRVFETCMPGAVFAVTVRDSGTDEVLWQRPPSLTGNEAQVLEIPLPQPRKLRTVRVYVSNNLGSGWSEIDTICLIADRPLPLSKRKTPKPHKGSALKWLLLLVALGIACAVMMPISGDSPTPLPPGPSARVDGTSLVVWETTVQGMMAEGTVWASHALGFSSEYSSGRNSATKALGVPDVFPAYGDLANAWAPGPTDDGAEWLTVRFPNTVQARSVVIVETYGAGAVARVEDHSVVPPVLLWEGHAGPSTSGRVLSVQLPTPRPIHTVRLVLDTTRASGWNEIDAVGLLPTTGP